jgi:hypothetical protein
MKRDIMSDDLAIAVAIGHSRRTAVIRQNVVLALAVKALFVILTFGGYATLWAPSRRTWAYHGDCKCAATATLTTSTVRWRRDPIT